MGCYLMLSPGYYPDIGGVQRTQYELAKWYGIKGVIISKYVQGCEKTDKLQKQKIIRVKRGLISKIMFHLLGKICYPYQVYFSFRPTLKSTLKKNKIGVIICSHIITGLLALKAKKEHNIPYVLFAHGRELLKPVVGKNPYSYRCIKNIMENASIIYVASDFTRKLAESWITDKEKIKKVCFVGADTKKFRPQKANKKLLQKWNLLSSKILLTVARLDIHKGVDFVIKSLPKVLKRYPNTKYLVVGGGGEMGNLKNLTKELNLESNVIFTGNINENELPDYFNLCNIFIMASRDCREKSPICKDGGMIEGFGAVFIEANACEKPVIGGDSGGIKDAIDDGKTGYLVNPTDINDISNKIIKLFSDKELPRKMGRDGRKRAVKKFNYKYAADIINDDLESLIRQG